MPALRKYEYDTKEELAEIRKERDRVSHFKRFWKNKYGITVNESDIDFFKKNKGIIKAAIPIMEQLKNIQFVE